MDENSYEDTYFPVVIPGWYEPDGDATEELNYEEYIEKINEQSLSYSEILERFYKKNFLVISMIQWLIMVILLIKILRTK